MSDRLGETLYLVIGVINLLIAGLITMGDFFSSFALGYGMLVFVDLSIVFGLIGRLGTSRVQFLFMAFGNSAVFIYIAVVRYYDYRSGFPMLLFHKVWAASCCMGIALSLFRFRQFRQPNGASPWQQ